MESQIACGKQTNVSHYDEQHTTRQIPAVYCRSIRPSRVPTDLELNTDGNAQTTCIVCLLVITVYCSFVTLPFIESRTRVFLNIHE